MTLDKTPALGAYIRNLRLDGGYAKHLQTIVECAPNIQCLSLNLNILSKNSLTGLLHSLPSLNPVELYLHGLVRFRNNKKADQLTEAVFDAMKNWEALVGQIYLRIPRASSILLSRHIFCDVVRAAGISRIRCYGLVGCLDRMYHWEGARVPGEIKRLVVYEETARDYLKRPEYNGSKIGSYYDTSETELADDRGAVKRWPYGSSTC